MTLMPAPALPRPYPEHALAGWSDEDWRRIPAVAHPIGDLVPTQEGVGLAEVARLINGGPPNGGDGWTGRAVCWRGTVFLHDGTTRWLISRVRGERWFWVRLVELDPAGEVVG